MLSSSIVPNAIIPYILIHPSKMYYNVNDNVSLSCHIKYPKSSHIDIDTLVNIQWLNSSKHILRSYTGLNDYNDYTEHTLNYTISNVKLSDAGKYTCSVFITASMNNNVILDSGTTSNFTNITIKRK